LKELKTPKEILEKDLPNRFKPEKAKGIDTVVQMNIKGHSGGNWIVAIKNMKMEIEEGIHPKPNLSIDISETDFLDLVGGKLNGSMAFFSGKLKFKGDIAVALKLRDAGFL
jgi:putative sterol carrier protein